MPFDTTSLEDYEMSENATDQEVGALVRDCAAIVDAEMKELLSRILNRASVIERCSATMVLPSEKAPDGVPVFERERHPDGTVGEVLRLHHLTEDQVGALLEAQARQRSTIMSAETCDHLDGRQLVDGERLGVTWPDGTTEDVHVKIYSGAEGSRLTLANRAYVVREYNGTTRLVRLAGVEAVRRLCP